MAHLNFLYSVSGPLGRQVIRKRGEAKIELMLQILGTMLRHYCETGKPVSRDRIARLIATSNSLTTTDRLRLLVNTLAMARKRDSFRQRYLSELAAGLRLFTFILRPPLARKNAFIDAVCRGVRIGERNSGFL